VVAEALEAKFCQAFNPENQGSALSIAEIFRQKKAKTISHNFGRKFSRYNCFSTEIYGICSMASAQ